MGEPFLYRIPAWLICGVLFLAMLALWETLYRCAERRRSGEPAHDLGPIDTGVAGLLALILAFSFSMASERFDAREEVIVREANALETTHLRCDFLVHAEQAACREALSRYAQLRVAFYESAHDLQKLRAVAAGSERAHAELWEIVNRSHASLDTPAQALTISSLNELIDLHTQRLAAHRRVVPQEVTLVTLALCVAWGGFAGYVCGLARNRQRVSWVGFSLLASLVIFVSVDLDRPGRGFIRPLRGHLEMMEVANRLAGQDAARRNQRPLPP